MRPRLHVAALVCSTLLLGLEGGSGASVRAEPVRYAASVAANDVGALESARLELQKNIAVGGAGVGEVAAWRYDWAYLNWRISQRLPGEQAKRRRSLLKEAERQLDLLLAVDPDNAEAHSLRGGVLGGRIDGGWSAALLGRRSGRAHEMALELAPENPRVAMQHGISLMFTPKTFGGGLEQAVPELRRAVDLFAGEPATAPWPNWGRADALTWLAIALADGGEVEEARGLLERALALEPANRWISGRLDQLESSPTAPTR